jgi:hypothetical protein
MSIPDGFTEKTEFKAILKFIQKSIPKMITKNLVDTLYSLAKFK